MKALVLAATVAAAFVAGGLSTSGADAAPYKKYGAQAHHAKIYKGKVTPGERAAIRHSRAHLSRVQARVYADGKVTTLERIRLGKAQQRHGAVVRKALR